MSKKRPPLTDESGEVRELTKEDMKLFKPIKEVMPEFLEAMNELKRTRGKQKSPTKISKTVRFSPEVVEYFEATGKGWQTRLNDVLMDYVEKKNKASARAANAKPANKKSVSKSLSRKRKKPGGRKSA